MLEIFDCFRKKFQLQVITSVKVIVSG